MVSRSILNEDIGKNDFHGCVYYEQFLSHDRSVSFADDIVEMGLGLLKKNSVTQLAPIDTARASEISSQCMLAMLKRFDVTDINLIKPGIGEATRVLLRRVPRLLIVKDSSIADVQHLLVLAEEKQIPIEVDAHLPYQAVAIIRSALDA